MQFGVFNKLSVATTPQWVELVGNFGKTLIAYNLLYTHHVYFQT